MGRIEPERKDRNPYSTFPLLAEGPITLRVLHRFLVIIFRQHITSFRRGTLLAEHESGVYRML